MLVIAPSSGDINIGSICAKCDGQRMEINEVMQIGLKHTTFHYFY